MKQEFIDYINKRSISSVRFALSNELLLDPRGFSFNEMKNYAEEVLGDELYEVDDNKTYSYSIWDKDALFELKNDLDFNFSREKLEMYETIAKVVLAEKAENLNIEEGTASSSQTTNEQSEPRNKQKRHYNVDKEPEFLNNGLVKLIIGGIAIIASIGLITYSILRGRK